MAELGLETVSLTFGGAPLLERVSLQVEPGERIGLLGRNGCGKSTLLRVMLGELEPDEGTVSRRKDLVIAGLEQEVPRNLRGPVGEFVASTMGSAAAWEVEKNVDRVLSWLALDPEADTSTLSAGNQRRVLLARALVLEPDVLLLDEPTNHLDVEAIERLEEALLRRKGALVFVTHDRAFLRRLATRILELDRGRLTSHDGDLESWLERREAALEAEERASAEFDKKLAKEEAWLRRGVKARRTRNMGRVRALQELRKERAARRDRVGTARGQLREADVSGQLVLRAEALEHHFGDHQVIRKLDLEI